MALAQASTRTTATRMAEESLGSKRFGLFILVGLLWWVDAGPGKMAAPESHVAGASARFYCALSLRASEHRVSRIRRARFQLLAAHWTSGTTFRALARWFPFPIQTSLVYVFTGLVRHNCYIPGGRPAALFPTWTNPVEGRPRKTGALAQRHGIHRRALR